MSEENVYEMTMIEKFQVTVYLIMVKVTNSDYL